MLWSPCDTIALVNFPAFAAPAHARQGWYDAGRSAFDRYLAPYRERIAFGNEFDPQAPLGDEITALPLPRWRWRQILENWQRGLLENLFSRRTLGEKESNSEQEASVM